MSKQSGSLLRSKRIIVQFIKFGMVGCSNTAMSLLVTYVVMAGFNHQGINATWSLNICTTVGYVAGVCNSYFWNSKYVFKDKKETSNGKVFVKMFICYGCTYLISMLLMDVLVEYMGIPAVIAPVPRLVVTIPLNFVANKMWAFKDKA